MGFDVFCYFLAILVGASYVLQVLFVSCSAGGAVVEFRAQWRQAALALRSLAWEVSTQKTYASYKKSYLDFCKLARYKPVPVSVDMVCEYIAFLSDRLSYASILKYIGIIRVMQLEMGLPDPKVHESYEVKLMLMAVKKLLGTTVKRRLPIGPELLAVMHSRLCHQSTNDTVFWAVCLVGFFGLLRASNLVAPPGDQFDVSKHLSRASFRDYGSYMVVTLLWAKNNQVGRMVQIPLPRLVGSVLCPVQAVRQAFQLTGEANLFGPAFMRRQADSKLTPVRYSWFSKKLLDLVEACGLDRSLYGTHRLRRGGASWALKCGFSSEVIRILGDWHSDAYQNYLEVPLEDKLLHMQLFAKSVSQVHV